MLDKIRFVVYALHIGGATMVNRVKEYRKQRGLTQAQLAERANICRPYLSAIESGKQTRISNVVMLQIARALQEPIDNIFFSNVVVSTQQMKEA